LDLRNNVSVNGESKITARITTNGRLTIPSRLRRRFGIKPGTPIVFWEEDNRIIFQPITRKYILSLRSSLKRKLGDKPFAEAWADHKREEKELEERKYQRLATLDKDFIPRHES
jgi:AbrB family looped-hinge helix DNA binding protein